MTLGNLIQISAQGPEDKFLYGNPQITYFKEVYKRSTNFAVNYTKVPFIGNDQADFGNTIRLNIPMKADLLAGIYMKIKLKDLERKENYTYSDGTVNKVPNFTSYINGIGFNCLDEVRLYINGILIETLNGELIYLMNELNNNYSQKISFYRMSRFYKKDFDIGTTNTTDVNTELLLPFFFTKKSSYYLPICALNHSNIEIQIKFKPLSKCIIHSYNAMGMQGPGINGYIADIGGDYSISNGNVPAQFEKYDEEVVGGIESVEIYSQNIYLEKVEKQMFMNKNLSYLVELFHIGSTHTIENPNSNDTYFIDITGNNPTKYILWMLQREDVFESNFLENTTYDFNLKYGDGFYNHNFENHILDTAQIVMNNSDVINPMDSLFLSDLQMFEKFNNSSLSPFYIYSFALKPQLIEPTGTMNLSRIKHKTIKIKLKNENLFTNNSIKPNILLRHYNCHYNILVIKSGLAGLMYQ
tara:strand:+ start:1177 stop:2586 length:1410 start_codon:yes stop_codon:yes gene_type:complete